MRLALVLLLIAAPLGAQGIPIDPDYCWSCRDSWEHFGSGIALDLGATLVPSRAWQRVTFVMAIGVVWEAGQADVARSKGIHEPGFGWSFKDLACDLAGALVGEAIHAIWGRR